MRLVRLILLVCVIAATLSWIGSRTAPQLRLTSLSLSASTPLSEELITVPIVIGGERRRSVMARLALPGQAVTADLRVQASSSQFEILNADARPLAKNCVSSNSQVVRCTARAHFGANEQFVTIVAATPVALEDVHADIWQAKHVAQTGHISVIFVLLFLLLLAPLFWVLRGAASQWCLIALAATWLTLASWQLAVAMLLFLLCVYATIRQFDSSPKRLRWFAICIMLAVGGLVLVKAVAPLAGQFFANPGEFFFLPLGFSYFIIRIIDTAFKAYARQLKNLGLREYFAYLLFPPTLAAGPIMSLPEFRAGTAAFANLTDRTAGLYRVCIGLGKKTVADLLMLYVIVPRMDGQFFGPDNSDVPVVLLANVLFVYLDFSAYSDLAIGVARWWGWRVPENFNFPLLQRNMRDFWRNWHMSLTQWVTRHVFMQASMEVRRSAKWLQVTVPTLSTMLVIGLWHGFMFTWVLWAFHHLAGIMLGDRVVKWANGPLGTSVLLGARSAVGQRVFSASVRIGGIAFVWWWVALSHSFTTTNSVTEALDNYIGLWSFGRM